MMENNKHSAKIGNTISEHRPAGAASINMVWPSGINFLSTWLVNLVNLDIAMYNGIMSKR